MPVQSTHSDYQKRLPQWARMRDALEGEDAVKGAGQEYLPKLSGQSSHSSEYEAYKTRASFYEATARTHSGLTGALTRKAPTISWVDDDVELFKSMGRDSSSLFSIMDNAANQLMAVGRVGHLLDSAPLGSALLEENTPYISSYTAENIVNWQEVEYNGRVVVSMVVLRELVQSAPDDPFVIEMEPRYRVLRLGTSPGFQVNSDGEFTGELADGFTIDDVAQLFYFQEIWVKNDSKEVAKKEEFVLAGVITPRMVGGRLVPYIPFVFTNPSGVLMTTDRPPLLGVADVNFAHYRGSADLEHGRHFTALPTAWAKGFGTDSLTIGSAVAWLSDEPWADASFLEFTGAGLGHLASGQEEKQKQMSVLGARILESQPRGIEAAKTVELRHGGENSALTKMASALDQTFSVLLRWYADWMALVGQEKLKEISVEFDKDYNPQGISAEMMQVIMAAAMAGQMSWSTFYHNLSRGEIYPKGRTEEKEADLIGLGLPGGILTPPNEDEQTNPDDEVEDLTTGVTDGHSHTYVDGDTETGSSEGHTHTIQSGADQTGNTNDHTHSL